MQWWFCKILIMNLNECEIRKIILYNNEVKFKIYISFYTFNIVHGFLYGSNIFSKMFVHVMWVLYIICHRLIAFIQTIFSRILIAHNDMANRVSRASMCHVSVTIICVSSKLVSYVRQCIKKKKNVPVPALKSALLNYS